MQGLKIMQIGIINAKLTPSRPISLSGFRLQVYYIRVVCISCMQLGCRTISPANPQRLGFLIDCFAYIQQQCLLNNNYYRTQNPESYIQGVSLNFCY